MSHSFALSDSDLLSFLRKQESPARLQTPDLVRTLAALQKTKMVKDIEIPAFGTFQNIGGFVFCRQFFGCVVEKALL
jgi:hypothetical protein